MIVDYLPTLFLLLIIIIMLYFIFCEDSKKIIINMILISSISTCFYITCNAPDVAMTEAAIGAALTSIFLLTTYYNFKVKTTYIKSNSLIILSLIALISLLITSWYFKDLLPSFGDLESEANNESYELIIQNVGAEIGVYSVTAAIIAGYRAFDSLVETLVIITAAIGMMAIFRSGNKRIFSNHEDRYVVVIGQILIPIIIFFAFNIQMQGETTPGGGFQAGSIMASATCAAMLCGNKNFIFRKQTYLYIMLLGLCIFISCGTYSTNLANNFLDYSQFSTIINGQKIGIFIVEFGIFISVYAALSLIFVQLLNIEEDGIA